MSRSLAEEALILSKKLEKLILETRKEQAQNAVNKDMEDSGFDQFMKGGGRAAAGTRRRLSTHSSVEELEERYHNIARTHKELGLKFSALQSAINAAKKSTVMAKVLKLDSSSSSDGRNPFSEDLDKEEIDFVKELLDDQTELSREVISKQKDILQSELDIMLYKGHLLESFTSLRELYDQLEEVENHQVDERTTDKRFLEKKKTLQKEEEKLNQMKSFIQTLMGAVDSLGMNFDEETNKTHRKMLLDCGKDNDELRAALYN